ncbi:MAG TPA: L,D-transpeptidase [Solirubrobacterales bacterium]|nr:L,D-transpeptidase [Solirubrobacterales bacterium]
MPSTPLFAASHTLRSVLAVACAAVLGLMVLAAGSAKAATPAERAADEIAPSKVIVKPFGLKHGRAKIMSTVSIGGSLRPYRPNQRVRVWFFHNGKKYVNRSIKVKKGKGNYGTFRSSVITKEGGKYAVQAKYYGTGGDDPVGRDSTERKSWKVRFVSLQHGECSKIVKGFRKALNDLAMVPDEGKCFNGKMDRAVLAYRKLNDFSRNSVASKTIVKRVFNREGGYHVRKPGLGDHMEAPLSKQVIVFAKGDKPYAIFPTASGAPATPTILGTFSFYRKDPGYNSLGMYYSSYFIRGYATHGYKSVPDYPASHGCLRTFIADQPRIYNITEIGMPVYTFGNAFRSSSVKPFSGGATPPAGMGPDLGPTGGLDPAAPASAD